jgi:hypothetical protein
MVKNIYQYYSAASQDQVTLIGQSHLNNPENGFQLLS